MPAIRGNVLSIKQYPDSSALYKQFPPLQSGASYPNTGFLDRTDRRGEDSLSDSDPEIPDVDPEYGDGGTYSI